MRNPNGFGGIKKLSGKRKKPYAVYVTTEFTLSPTIPEIDFLSGILTPDLYEQVLVQYEAYKARQPIKGRQIQKCIGYYKTRPEAIIALSEYNKNPFDIDKRNVTFAQIYEMLYEKEIKKKDISAANVYTTAYQKCGPIKQMKIRDIRLLHMQNIVDSYSDKSRSTQNNIIILFHAIFEFCMKNDIVEKDYSQFVKITEAAEKKDKLPFTRQEVQTVWDNINWLPHSKSKNSLYGLHMMDTILIMLYTGMRIRELLEIKPADIHIDERWIDLRGTKTKAAQRVIPIHKKIIPLIEKRLAYCDGEYLFHENNNNKLSYGKYRAGFYDYFMEEFKIKKLPHECRHTFATISATCGMNKILRKKIIGHASGDITDDVYTHAYIEDLIAEIDKYDL